MCPLLVAHVSHVSRGPRCQISRTTRKPDARVGVVGIAAQPPRRTRLRRRTRPRTTAHHPRPATGVDPGRAVTGRAPVAVVPAIGDPFADIAGQVVKAVSIRLVAAHRRRAPGAVAVAGECVAASCARSATTSRPPVKLPDARRRRCRRPTGSGWRSGAQRVFELGLAGQRGSAARSARTATARTPSASLALTCTTGRSSRGRLAGVVRTASRRRRGAPGCRCARRTRSSSRAGSRARGGRSRR